MYCEVCKVGVLFDIKGFGVVVEVVVVFVIFFVFKCVFFVYVSMSVDYYYVKEYGMLGLMCVYYGFYLCWCKMWFDNLCL